MNDLGKWLPDPTNLTAVSTLVVALFTAVLAVATIRLWGSTKGLHIETRRLAELAEEQSKDMKASISVADKAANAAVNGAEIARRTMYETQRAFVFMRNIEVEVGINDVIAFKIHWINSGATPAINCDGWTDDACVQGEPPGFPTRKRPVAARATNIGPNAGFETTAVVSLSDIRKSEQRKATLYIWSIVEYDDFLGTGTRHETQICMRVLVGRDIDVAIKEARESETKSFHSPFTYNVFGPQNLAT